MPTMKRIKAKGYKGVYFILGTSPAKVRAAAGGGIPA